MKNTYLFLILILGIIISCNNDNINSSSESNRLDLRNSEPDFTPFNIPFPEGTTFEITGNELHFTLPDPYFIVGYDSEGGFHQSTIGGSGGVTCKCTEGSGCNPIKAKGEYGCLMTQKCKTCTQSSASISGVDVPLTNIAIFSSNINLFVDDFSQLDGKYLLPHNFLDFPPISDILTELQNNMQGGNTSDMKIVFLNLYDYILPIAVPSDMDNTSLSLASDNGGDRGEVCTCNIGASCPRKSKFGVVWCDADNCTSCTMRGIVSNDDGETRIFSEHNGLISIQ